MALDNVNLTLDEAKIYGLLGRNGAGKTTLLNLITGKTHPSQGTITLDGVPVWENDQALGRIFCMTEANLYPESLRVGEIFRWTAKFYPKFDLHYAGELTQRFGLSPRRRSRPFLQAILRFSRLS
ncbi:MAG: ATP-binding cassette domain-containing protein [Firmicutes bacterium]|nr:ATP-binding cassette domain-containing protein [Bacillota bacterium]